MAKCSHFVVGNAKWMFETGLISFLPGCSHFVVICMVKCSHFVVICLVKCSHFVVRIYGQCFVRLISLSTICVFSPSHARDGFRHAFQLTLISCGPPLSITIVTESSTKNFSMRNGRKARRTRSSPESATKQTRNLVLTSRQTAEVPKSGATKEPRGPGLSYPVQNGQFGCPVITCPKHSKYEWAKKKTAYMHYLRHHSSDCTSISSLFISC